jgi:Tol biopolymer transport system component
VNITNTNDGGFKHPIFLPDGRHFLFTASGPTAELSGIFVGSLDSNGSRRILPDISGAVLTAGMLLFVRDNTLVAQPFDTASGQLTGGAIPVDAGVAKTSNIHYAPVTASDTGLLLYQTGGDSRGNQFLWVDRTGKTLEAVGSPGRMNNPALSHDEKRLLFTSTMAGPIDTWVRDLARGTEQRLITSPPFENAVARWSPGGDSVVFGSDRLGVMNLFLKNLSDGQEQPLVVNNSYKAATQWSRDGRFIVYTQVDSQTNRDIWVIPMEGSKPGQPVAFLHTNANEFLGQLSPDSKWMAYTSDESGRREVYVRAFPSGQNLTSISLAGGEAPRWSADGRELFFVAADGRMNAVPVKSAGSTFEPGTPVPLFNANLIRSPNEPLIDYDVSSDGKRFLITTAAQGPTSATLNLISNWTAALNR